MDRAKVLYGSAADAIRDDKSYENLSGSYIMASFDSYRDSYEGFFDEASEEELLNDLEDISTSAIGEAVFDRNYSINRETGYPETVRDALMAQDWINRNPHDAAKFMEGLQHARTSEDIDMDYIVEELNDAVPNKREFYKQSFKQVGSFLLGKKEF